MKGVHIYMTKNYFKIATMYKLESGSYIDSNPIYIVSKDTSIEEISSKIASALKSSKKISEKEEDIYWLGNKLLKELKETSFNKLYENSKSCVVYVVDSETIIKPYEFKGKENGLIVDEDKVVKLKSEINHIDLTKIIMNLLMGNVSN